MENNNVIGYVIAEVFQVAEWSAPHKKHRPRCLGTRGRVIMVAPWWHGAGLCAGGYFTATLAANPSAATT